MVDTANKLKPFEPITEQEASIVSTLCNRYEFIRRLGEGPFARVYAVINKTLDRLEALKVLSDDLVHDHNFLDRFKVEARLCASFAHPNIVTIYDYRKLSRYYYFSMFFVDGPPLTKYIKHTQTMPAHRICKIIATISQAIHYAHQRGVIHRDIKASNIMLDRTGKPYITDFGIAKWDRSLTETKSGVLLGTPHYFSPEQIRGHHVDGRSDIYSLGVTLYALLTKNYPFQGGTAMSVIAKRLTEAPVPPENYKPDLSPELSKRIKKALQPDPGDRFQTAAEFGNHLHTYAHSEKKTVRSVAAGSRESKPKIDTPIRRIVKWGMIGAVTILVFVSVKPIMMHTKSGASKVAPHGPAATIPSGKAEYGIQDPPDSKRSRIQDAETAGQSNHLQGAETKNKQADTGRPKVVDAEALQLAKTLDTHLKTLREHWDKGDYEGCIQTADMALSKLNQSASQPSAFGDLQVQLYRYKSKAMEKLTIQKYNRQFKRLAAAAEHHYQKGDYQACIDSTIAASNFFTMLSNDQKKNMASIRSKVHRLQKDAKTAKLKQERLLSSGNKRSAHTKFTWLRNQSNKILERDIKTAIAKHHFFDFKRNKAGTFSNQFVDNQDGTITDETTELMWEQVGSSKRLERQKARHYIENLNRPGFAGHSDWRLPTVEELASLLEERPSEDDGLHHSPIFSNAKVHNADSYWSADTCQPIYGCRRGAWIVNFKKGTILDAYWSSNISYTYCSHTAYYFVRAVRSKSSK